jgi:glycosyltransferase involved in cell wall biosynthesis
VPKLSVIIITRNEAGQIGAALDSVAWADEIVVVDADSSDDTAAQARQRGARVEVRAWPGYAAQKNHAASLASHDWLLSLDADERVTPELAAEIRALLAAGDPPRPGYRMPRVTYAFDRWIRTTDWYPDRQLRLYDRRVGRWNEQRRVHESVILPDGRGSAGAKGGRVAGELRGELQHLGYHGITHHVGTINRYTTLAAEDLAGGGRRAGTVDLLVHGPAAFLRNYLLRGGWRDGSVGLVISLMNAYYVLLKQIKLWELQRQRQGQGRSADR